MTFSYKNVEAEIEPDVKNMPTGAPNEKIFAKYLKYHFLLS